MRPISSRQGGLGMVVVVNGRHAPRQMPHGEREPTFELVVIIAVEEIVLAIVLVVQYSLGRREAGFQQLALGLPLAARRVSPLPPAEIGVGELGIVLPDALVEQRLQASAVSAGLRPEDAIP